LLERLTAQSVELITHAQRENEAFLTRVIGLVENLARIVQSHERRISGLEEA